MRRITVQSKANSLWDPISKNLSQNRAGSVDQGKCPELKTQYCKKKKKEASLMPSKVLTIT
jgi:hypothetical protein